MTIDPRVTRKPAMPEYDARRDGNPFAWVIAQAAIVRAQRHAAAVNVRTLRRLELGSIGDTKD